MLTSRRGLPSELLGIMAPMSNADMRLNGQLILIDQRINVCMWAPAPVIPRIWLGCECVVYPVGPRIRQRDNVHCTADNAPMPAN